MTMNQIDPRDLRRLAARRESRMETQSRKVMDNE